MFLEKILEICPIPSSIDLEKLKDEVKKYIESIWLKEINKKKIIDKILKDNSSYVYSWSVSSRRQKVCIYGKMSKDEFFNILDNIFLYFCIY